jgi:protein SCO1
MNWRFVIPVLAIALIAAGVVAAALTRGSDETQPPDFRGSRPPPGIAIPAFSLRDSEGGIVATEQLRGKVVLVTFLESRCREACPIIAGVIGQALERLTAAERHQVVALAISVNPKDDTRASVRTFLRGHHVLSRLRYLVGSTAELRPLWKDFGVVSALDTGSADIHSADLRVFDRDGVWRSTLHVPVDLTPANLAHDIRLVLSE